jgi:hypothetical protein
MKTTSAAPHNSSNKKANEATALKSLSTKKTVSGLSKKKKKKKNKHAIANLPLSKLDAIKTALGFVDTGVAPSQVKPIKAVIAPAQEIHSTPKLMSRTVEPASVPEEAPKKPKTDFVDLHPWPFEKKFTGMVKRREWNKLVTAIRASGCMEAEKENESLHATVAELLNERDALKSRLDEMRAHVLKDNREFEARFN